jgi:hypothetical protein
VGLFKNVIPKKKGDAMRRVRSAASGCGARIAANAEGQAGGSDVEAREQDGYHTLRGISPENDTKQFPISKLGTKPVEKL